MARQLPAEGAVATGLCVDDVAAPAGVAIDGWLAERAEARLDAPVALVHGERVVVRTSLRGLGATVDEQALHRAVAAFGHRGTLLERIDESLAARAGRARLRTRVRLPAEPLASLLRELKAELDVKPRPARWDFSAQRAVGHQQGRAVDVHATLESILSAADAGEAEVAVVVTPTEPRVTTDVVGAIDRTTVIGRYETHFAYLGGQAGRAQNVARAASLVDGAVLMPGEVVSFNALVGPRSLANGFAHAGEIYKGEMRIGVGGGTCQVASTLYAVSFFAALDIVERSPHSRPSGYVPAGLDATVAYPDVDLKLRNPFPFPLVVHAEVTAGTLAFSLHGQERLATVSLGTRTVGVKSHSRKVREASWLAEGRVVRKQKGSRGLTIAKTRTIRFRDGSERVEESRDVYPPADEIYLVPAGADPDSLLPPPPDAADGQATAVDPLGEGGRSPDAGPASVSG